jgi:hypothetical protein
MFQAKSIQDPRVRVEVLTDLAGVVDPRIAGGGIFFRRWSAWFRSSIEQHLTRDKDTHASLLSHSRFTAPLTVTAIRHAMLRTHLDLLNQRIAQMRRVMAATYLKFPKLYFDPNEVKGLWFQKKRLECHSPSKWGQYEIRCDGTGKEFACFIKNRSSREQILRGFYAQFTDEFHESVLSVLRARKAVAKSLGYPSWTHMQLAMNGCSGDSVQALDALYKSGLGVLKKRLARMRSIKLDVNDSPRKPNSIDEQFLITQSRSPLEFKKSKLFEYNSVLEKVLKYLSEIFHLKFSPVESSLWMDGWHKDVRIFEVRDNRDRKIGHVYLDLFRRPLSSGLGGAGPHCSPLMPSGKHVRVFMGLQPPYRSDVTFKKERYLTMEEITALMHEFGHAIHVLSDASPISQLPMHARESFSILCELLSLTDDFLDFVSDRKLNEQDKNLLRRDEWFYADIIRNVAVSEYIHSDKFDPDTASVQELRSVCRKVYAQFSPLEMCDFVDPLAGELSNYLIDGESRIGYLASYERACALQLKARKEALPPSSLVDSLRQLLENDSGTPASMALETYLNQSVEHVKLIDVTNMLCSGSIWAGLSGKQK